MNEIVKKVKNNNFLIYVIGLSIMIFTIVLIRAATSAITWDEAYTYIAYAKNFSIKELIDIGSNLANNHILNTVMIAIIDKLCNIPYNEFIIRLPNIIMLIFYFIGSYMISRDEKHKYLLFTGLVLNYYVMEFFGLARGYGMATSFTIWMCYFFKKASKNDYDDKNIFISVIFGLLACYSNTISILSLFAICLIYLMQLIRKKETIKFIKRNIIKIIPIAILLIYIVIFHFIVTGSDKPVFGGTGEAKGLTIIGFLEKNFVWMFVENSGINIVVSIIGIIFIIVSILFFRKEILKRPFFSVILALIIALIVPSMILGKPYPIERCLIPLWPLVVLGIVDIYSLWTDKMNIKISKIVTGCIIFVLIFAFVIRINIKETRTWKNNYPVRDIAYQALFEQRTLTPEEYEENKGYFGLEFYRQKILEQYNFDIVPKQ